MRVLFLTHRVPYAPNRGDRIRAYHILRYFKARQIPVCLVALAHEPDERDGANGLSELVDAVHLVHVPRKRNLVRGAARLAGPRTLTHMVLDSPALAGTLARVRHQWKPDVVLALCSSMARFAMEPALEGLPFVLDLLDVDSFKWGSLARASRGPWRWIYDRECRLLRRFEVEAARAASATMVVSEKEAAALRGLDPSLRPVVVPVGVDVDGYRNRGAASRAPQVVFTGVFNYRPNVDGAQWLMHDVWPLVLQEVPDATLSLVGSGPGRGLRRQAARAGVAVTGAVPDVRPYLWSASVTVAPLHTARGVQNKVLEGVAAGLPAVVTQAVYDGLPPAVRAACEFADSPEDFAAAIVRLVGMPPDERARVVAAASLHALRWELCLEPLEGLLRDAVDNRIAI